MGKFLNQFDPVAQSEFCLNTNDCYFGEYPTLAEVRKEYGINAPTIFLVGHLFDLSEYSGSKGKLMGTALEDCASVIADEFYFLKVTELMLFFHRFKSGRYGRFYGSVDPLVITESLRKFIDERDLVLYQREMEIQEQKRIEGLKNCISYEEYLKRKGSKK